MIPVLGQQYWLTVPADSECYAKYKHWSSSETGIQITVQDIRLGNPDGVIDVVISYDPFGYWATGLMVPSGWLSIHKQNPKTALNFCKCNMDLLMNRGCQCGGV